jgi:starch phosphorylase
MTWAGSADIARASQALASRLPPELGVLAEIAFNYRWSWLSGGPEVFRDVDPYRWEVRRENPVRLLLEVPAESLAKARRSPDILARAHHVHQAIQDDLARPFSRGTPDHPVAFLCAEFGVHRSLPTYGGGLGILAGDILKEASDQALPMVGIGILYRQGNFHQAIDTSGWQTQSWRESDPDRLPIALVAGENGSPLTITVPLRGRDVVAQVWRADVGRVPLYLLDTQRPENSRVDRWITARLYIADRSIRLAQYALLGIGAIRALRAMGIDPAVVHVNEGHGALAALELAREEVAAGRSFEEALEAARLKTVFTTHTPVPAGNEKYGADEIAGVLGDLAGPLHTDERTVLGLGRSRPEDEDEPLGLTVLAIRMARSVNAVSRLHGQVARLMWQHLFPGKGVDEVPIDHVTNGVHLPTWMAPRMRSLLDRYLGDGWQGRAADPSTWQAVDAIPDEELWATRRALRADLVRYVHDRIVGDRLARGEPIDYAQAGAHAFDPDVLTVGFARRVAAYKRLDLLIHDLERTQQLLRAEHPLQLVLAGKAHPADMEAKLLLQRVFLVKVSNGGERAVFLEDYDMSMAGHLVSGSDLWLNLPRAPLEASGTSGMKAALNGGLNLSVLDGWWAEAYDGTNGWAIEGDASLEPGAQDEVDGAALYELFERDVVPLFYDRDPSGVPRGWIQRLKTSLKTIGPRFCATRMLQEYADRIYRI